MKEQIKKIILENEFFHGTGCGYCIEDEHAELIANLLDKAIGIDAEKLYEKIKEVPIYLRLDMERLEEFWREASKAIAQSRPLECKVVEYAQPCNHRPDCTCQYCD